MLYIFFSVRCEVKLASHMSQLCDSGSTTESDKSFNSSGDLEKSYINKSFSAGSVNSQQLSRTFVFDSPITLRGKQGGRRGRRPTAELLHTRSPKQKSIENFVRIKSGGKRKLIEEISESLDVSCAPPPVKKSSVVFHLKSDQWLAKSLHADESNISSESEPSSLARQSGDSLIESPLRLSPSAVTSSPVNMGNEDLVEVKNLVSDLLAKFQNMESEVKDTICKQSAESDKKIESLKQLVSSLDTNLNAKVSDLEKRLAQCESAIAGSSREGGVTGEDPLRHFLAGTQATSGAQALPSSIFYADFLKMRKFMLKQERDGRRCNIIIRGFGDTTSPALTCAAEFFNSFFNFPNCVSYARWLAGRRGGLFVALVSWDAKKWIFKYKRDALKNTSFYIDHDLSDEDAFAAKSIRDVCRRCRDLRLEAKKGFNTVWINKERYTFDPLSREFSPPLPSVLGDVVNSRTVPTGDRPPQGTGGGSQRNPTTVMEGVEEQSVRDNISTPQSVTEQVNQSVFPTASNTHAAVNVNPLNLGLPVNEHSGGFSERASVPNALGNLGNSLLHEGSSLQSASLLSGLGAVPRPRTSALGFNPGVMPPPLGVPIRPPASFGQSGRPSAPLSFAAASAAGPGSFGRREN